MPALRELQSALRRALLLGEETPFADLVHDDGLPYHERLAVYRNNVVSSLTAVLKDLFPATCRLVGEPFFDQAARSMLRHFPPEEACLARFGAHFPRTIAMLEACEHLDYLFDVAWLEWLMHVAATAPEPSLIGPEALREVEPAATPRLRFRLHPSLNYIESEWPIDRIWRANRPAVAADDAGNAEPGDGGVDLAAGGVRLEVLRRGEGVVMRQPLPAAFAFRRSIGAGETLEAATEAALAEDSGFDLAGALAALFQEGLVVEATLATASAEKAS